MCRKIGGLEELLRCLLLVPALDGDKLLEVLEAYGFGQLYQKAGFILETFKDELSLPDTFFAERLEKGFPKNFRESHESPVFCTCCRGVAGSIPVSICKTKHFILIYVNVSANHLGNLSHLD